MTLITKTSITVVVSLFLTACGGSSSPNTPTPPPSPPPTPPSGVVNTVYDAQITVEKLYLDGDAQLAGATDGFYWRANAEASWENRSPVDAYVRGIAIIAPSHYIVALQPDGESPYSEPAPLYVTQDSGASWNRINHDFGGSDHAPIYGLSYDQSSDSLYGIGMAAFAVSNSSATHWTLLDGDWDSIATGLHLIEPHPSQNIVWFGGQGAIENGYLSRYSTVDGQVTTWSDLFPNPSTYFGGLIHPSDTQTVIFGAEGGLALSRDNGATWEKPLGDVDYTFYWDIVIDENGTLYTASYDKSGAEQPLEVLCSSDNGANWHSNDLSDEVAKGGVKSLMIVELDTSTELYLGLWDNGIKSVATSDLDCG
ncbi:hypothetical protein PSI9734_01178 [Pseudidiomarina piscicola]|uniref:Ycf48-like protein n=1 Tax=Pseudidiomarina piscicola TaxID=2614830 RepID=A0A6S6WP88_9GAMM|nr:hypothetical protein [Pseudidiomarina piscicola]CAB0150738.1 hypothetical protein PSI9734_01178 [Pseudidiomarina piscicola]VZT40243.1 hypothetical protein PSI9734_01178 [Pseudomonas aeruginosa]